MRKSSCLLLVALTLASAGAENFYAYYGPRRPRVARRAPMVMQARPHWASASSSSVPNSGYANSGYANSGYANSGFPSSGSSVPGYSAPTSTGPNGTFCNGRPSFAQYSATSVPRPAPIAFNTQRPLGAYELPRYELPRYQLPRFAYHNNVPYSYVQSSSRVHLPTLNFQSYGGCGSGRIGPSRLPGSCSSYARPRYCR